MKSMTIRHVQDYVQEVESAQGWDTQTASFGGLLLTEESGEVADAVEDALIQALLSMGLQKSLGKLARAVRREEVGRFGHGEQMTQEQKVDEIGMELADTLFAIVKIANHYKIDLADYFERLQEKMTNRFPEGGEK